MLGFLCKHASHLSNMPGSKGFELSLIFLEFHNHSVLQKHVEIALFFKDPHVMKFHPSKNDDSSM